MNKKRDDSNVIENTSHDQMRRTVSQLVWATPVITAISLPAHAQMSATLPLTFSAKGRYDVVIPNGVTSIDVVLEGGGGGGGGGGNGGYFSMADDGGDDTQSGSAGGDGGEGEKVITSIPVTPGETLIVEVGGGGASGTYTTPQYTVNDPGEGGEASSLFRGATLLATASGGGGGGSGAHGENSGAMQDGTGLKGGDGDGPAGGLGGDAGIPGGSSSESPSGNTNGGYGGGSSAGGHGADGGSGGGGAGGKGGGALFPEASHPGDETGGDGDAGTDGSVTISAS